MPATNALALPRNCHPNHVSPANHQTASNPIRSLLAALLSCALVACQNNHDSSPPATGTPPIVTPNSETVSLNHSNVGSAAAVPPTAASGAEVSPAPPITTLTTATSATAVASATATTPQPGSQAISPAEAQTPEDSDLSSATDTTGNENGEDNLTQADPAAAPAARLRVVRATQWPAGGRELTLLSTLNQEPAPLDSSALSVALPDGQELSFSLTQTPLAPGYTAAILAGTTVAARAAAADALRAFIAERPVRERIAVFGWASTLQQLASFTSDRKRLSRAIDRFEGQAIPAAPAGAELIIREVMKLTRAIGGIAPRLMRSVVILSDADWATSAAETLPTLSVNTALLADSPSLSPQLDALAAQAHYSVALCAPPTVQSVTVTRPNTAAVTELLPASLPEQTDGTCDLTSIGPGLRTYPQELALVFDESQREIFDTYSDENDKNEFELSIRFAAEQPTIAAKATLHGQSSLFCERQSMTINLAGKLARHLMPDSALNEFYLISMCNDTKYVHQYTANQVMQEHGLFGLRSRFIPLSVDGVSRGVYLLLEKSRETLEQNHSRVTSVFRRRFSGGEAEWELKGKDADEAEVVAITSFMSAITTAGVGTATVMQTQMDVDRYLTFLAINTAVLNGDYVDELWFYGTETLDQAGQVSSWYDFSTWDVDDTFTPCHQGGRNEWPDPNGVVHCAESELAKALLSDPPVYERFIDILDDLLTTSLTEERWASVIEETRAALTPLLENAEITQAMPQFETELPTEALTSMTAELDDMVLAFAEQRNTLLNKIQIYRDQGPATFGEPEDDSVAPDAGL